jgi:hypothetical protein
MSWYRRFKNRKNCPPYDINGKDIEDLVQEYFDENELTYSRRWVDYRFDKAVLRVMRRTPYEFALDEIHTLFGTLTKLPEYYIELDYIRQELNWFRELINDDQKLIYTLDWLLDPTTRPIYFFLKYRSVYLKHVQTSSLFKPGSIVSLFPCDPDFGNVYYNNEDVTKVVAGSEKRGKIWESGGFSKHRIFGHQWATCTGESGQGNGFEPLHHPRFRSRTRTEGKRYEV